MDMNNLEFLSHLRSLNIKLSLEGEQLRLAGDKKAFTPELTKELTLRKPELINFLKKANMGADASIKPSSREGNIPLSFAQQGLWFLDQLEGETGSYNYNITHALKLEGKLNIPILEKTLNTIIHRHETLRTSFQDYDGIPCQEIAPKIELKLPIIDLQNLSPTEYEQQFQKLASAEAKTPFKLSEAPLIRFKLLHISQDIYILLIVLHHIIVDGWSIGILNQEICTIYSNFYQEKDNSLPPLSIQYADFVAWQRATLTDEILTEQVNYWQKKLANIPPLLELPTDYPRPPLHSQEGAIKHFTLTPEVSQKLKSLSQENGCTLFMCLLGAFSTLLYRYTGQADLVIGSPIINRNRPEIESLIGYFLNTLVFRTLFHENPSFHQLLNQVKQTCIEAYSHQDAPFESLVEALNVPRDLSYSPIFQVMFAMENYPKQTLEFPDLKVSELDFERGTSKVDLILFIDENEDQLTGALEYNTDLFTSHTIERMIANFQVLLEGIVTNPDTKISQLPILTSTEETQILREWNHTQFNYDHDDCVHQLFEEQVKKTPDAIALILEEKTLTYQELNEKANQLAHYLRKLGVKPDTLVGLCLERSFNMIIGVLGILKAGGAYVPIDLNYPSDRIDYMLADSQVEILLTQNDLIDKLTTFKGKKICLDTNWQEIAQENQQNPTPENNLNHLIYVIYTSGSTGKPKGVLLNHYTIANLVKWQVKTTQSPQAKTLQFSPISFDVSCQEIFSTLSFGGSLVLIQEEQRQDFNLLTNYVAKQEIERLFIPFVGLQIFTEIANLNQHQFPHLKEIITAGEQLKLSSSIRSFFERLNHCTLHNHYGPSESHVVTAFTLPPTLKNCAYLAPIGFPINNTQIYLLDSELKPVPIGVTGELYIGGNVIARGYLHRDDLTQEKFISNPFQAGKLYKTGDLARYLPDGNIQYIGRIDNQVKIRGFRIELGEIEATLNKYHDIEETVVITTENAKKEKSIVAYYIAKNQADLSGQNLKEFLKDQLPEYMIPSAFIPLEKFPLSPNGKVDRKALPQPENYHQLSSPNEVVLPNTKTEKMIAQIWADILNLQQVGIKDNFFDIGGNSVRSIQMVARISKIFQITFPLKDFFKMPTIAELAQKVETLTLQTQSNEDNFTSSDQSPFPVNINPIRTEGATIPLYFVQIEQQTLINPFLKYLDPKYAIYSISNLGEIMAGILAHKFENFDDIGTTVESLVTQYVDALLKFQPQGPYYFLGFSFGGVIAYEMARKLTSMGHYVDNIILLDTANPSSTMDQTELKKDRIFRHLRGLKESGLAYITSRIPWQVSRLKYWLSKKYDKLFGKTLFDLTDLMVHDVMKYHNQLQRDYTPQKYHGKVTLFSAKDGNSAYQDVWTDLTDGKLHIINVSGTHDGMFEEPQVQFLIKNLDQLISK
jgi:amino acid adenylation domain-containing protein